MSIAQDIAAKLAAAEQTVTNLREELAAVMASEKKDVVTGMVEKILVYGITVEDLFPSAKCPVAAATRPVSDARKTVKPKYINPETGETWAGRGRCPAWLVGKNKDDFLITAVSGSEAEAGTAAAAVRSPVATDAASAAVAGAGLAEVNVLPGAQVPLATNSQPAGVVVEGSRNFSETSGAEPSAMADHAPDAPFEELGKLATASSHALPKVAAEAL